MRVGDGGERGERRRGRLGLKRGRGRDEVGLLNDVGLGDDGGRSRKVLASAVHGRGLVAGGRAVVDGSGVGGVVAQIRVGRVRGVRGGLGTGTATVDKGESVSYVLDNLANSAVVVRVVGRRGRGRGGRGGRAAAAGRAGA